MSRNTKPSEAMNSKIAGLLRAVDHVSEWGGKIASFFIAAATIQVCYELFLRYVLNAPTTWGLEMTLYLCSITYLMAGAYAERLNAHIKVDIFYSRWRPRVRALFDLFLADTFFLFFSGVLVWQSASWFWEAVTQGLTSGTIWDPPIWPMRLVVLIGGFTLWLSALVKVIRDIFVAAGNKGLA